MTTDAPAPPAVVRPADASPATASALSFYTPLAGIGISALAVTGVPGHFVGLPLMALGTGAGHLYAGDPWRAGLVGLGGTAVPAAAFGVGFGLGTLLFPPFCSESFGECHTSPGIVPVMGIVAGLGTAIWYLTWAAGDAATTAERRNAERRATEQPAP